ncbi:MAG: hypothetical protein ACKOBW_04300 [Planctomycetota bacterium]
MNAKDITQAKDPDLRGSYAALHRAAQLARETAIRTGTDLIIVENEKIVRISATTLAKRSQDAHSS